MMRRYALMICAGSSRAILEVSAADPVSAVAEARHQGRELIRRLEEWTSRDHPWLPETAAGAAVYIDWGPEGYQGQAIPDER